MANTRQEAAARRRDLRQRIKSVRAELAEARRERKRALFEAKERCRAERLAVKERSRALRMQVLRDLKDVTRAERETAQRACRERIRGARELPSRAARRHAELVAERRRETELRRIERAERARKKASPAAACLSCTHESDDEVRSHLTSDLLPLFDRVGPSIRGGAGQTRTEAFLKYAESHPDEVLAESRHVAETRVEALEAEHRELQRGLGHKPNPYEEKKAARLARMRARAERKRAEAGAAETRARPIVDRIPLGHVRRSVPADAGSTGQHPPQRIADVIRIRPVAATREASARPRLKGEGLDTVGVAKRIREDIALDVREGRLPKASYRVRTEKYSMGSTILVEASGFDFPVLNPDAFHVVGKWVELDREHFGSRFTEEAQYVDRMLNQIVGAYHWDKSDPMTDYYNERFHRDVRVVTRKGEWDAIEKRKLAEAGLGENP